MNLSLNIGKDREGKFYLILADQDSEELYTLAEFLDESLCDLYVGYMETQGYASIDLPSSEELEKFFE